MDLGSDELIRLVEDSSSLGMSENDPGKIEILQLSKAVISIRVNTQSQGTGIMNNEISPV